jgi:prepilin-type N-terminal cleavage/methylation domain-containing protein
MKMIKKENGFTLVELVIGMAIMTLVMGGLVYVLGISVKSYQYSQKRTYEVQQARNGINGIIDDLRNATAIIEPTVGSTGNRLIYTMNAINHTIELPETGSNANRILNNSTPLTANIVRDISFQRTNSDARILRVIITLNNPDNQSSGDFILDTAVFVPRLNQ